MKSNLLVFGASEHGRVIADIILKTNDYQLIGFVDSNKFKEIDLWGFSILGDENDLPEIIKNYNVNAIVIGIGDNFIREKVLLKLIDIPIKYATVIHPSAVIGKNVKIGEGSVIMANSIIGCNSVIGKHCIVNTKASLDHDSFMDDYSSLAPGVTTGGNVKIGKYSAIGLGCNIIHGIKIGANVVSGAGSVIINDIPDNILTYGIPSKNIKERKLGEKYL